MLDLSALDDSSVNEAVRVTFFSLYEVLRNQARQLTQLEKKMEDAPIITREHIESMTSVSLKANTKDVSQSMDEVLRLTDEKLLGVHKMLRQLEKQLADMNMELTACTSFQAQFEEQESVKDGARQEEMREHQRDIGRIKCEIKKHVKSNGALEDDVKSMVTLLDSKINVGEIAKIERKLTKKQKDETDRMSEEIKRLCGDVTAQVEQVAIKVDSRIDGVVSVAAAEVQEALAAVPTLREVQEILDQAQREMATFVEDFKMQHKTIEERLRMYESQKADISEVNLALEHKANRAEFQSCLTDTRNIARELVLKASVEDVMILLDSKADAEHFAQIKDEIDAQMKAIRDGVDESGRMNQAADKLETEKIVGSIQQAWSSSLEKLSQKIDEKTDYADFLRSLSDQKRVNDTLCGEQHLLLEWAETCGHTIKRSSPHNDIAALRA